jgi:hypothetical protein
VAIHFSGQTVFSICHIEGIKLGAGEEVDEVSGGTSGKSVNRIGEVGDRASEEQAAGGMGQVLQQGLWQGNEPGVIQGGWGTRLVLKRS